MSEPILKTPLRYEEVEQDGMLVCYAVVDAEGNQLFTTYRKAIAHRFVSACNYDLDAFASELHKRIMNLPVNTDQLEKEGSMYNSPEFNYRMGHKASRHAAAELAVAMLAELGEGNGK